MGVNETENTLVFAIGLVSYSVKISIFEKRTTKKLQNSRIIIENLV